MTLRVISDLHIKDEQDPLYGSALKLVRSCEKGDTLVIAGDLFDFFVGENEIHRDRFSEFFDEMTLAGHRGVTLHYIEGNHDFNLRRALVGMPNLSLHDSSVELELAGKRFYVDHGDQVDRKDYGYRILRRFLRSFFMKAFIKWMPDSLIEWIGTSSTEKGRSGRKEGQPHESRLDYLSQIYRDFAQSKISQGFDYVVMGHIHVDHEFEIQADQHKGQYINVGYPRVHGSTLKWTPDFDKIQRDPLP